ncbi:MAG: PEGA domain-containing protein, partial [Gemmatimonadetes bacterium]|nr:PEGA domain-containing protein [Gemmatimonadota bacterium]
GAGGAGAAPGGGASAARSSSGAVADTSVLLSVLSSVPGVTVMVNRVTLGATPVSVRVPRGRLATILAADGDVRRDTVLYVSGRHDLVVTVEREGPAAERGAGAPLPVASALSRSSLETEMAYVLPPLPRQPVVASMRTPRGARTDLYWSLAVAGIASLASSPHCRRQATAPEPYGGTYTGSYHPAGTFVPSAFLLCGTAIGLTAGAASFPVFRIFSRFANDGARTQYLTDSASFPQRQAAFLQLRQMRESMIDSVYRQRQAEAFGSARLRWRVDTIPRRLP